MLLSALLRVVNVCREGAWVCMYVWLEGSGEVVCHNYKLLLFL